MAQFDRRFIVLNKFHGAVVMGDLYVCGVNWWSSMKFRDMLWWKSSVLCCYKNLNFISDYTDDIKTIDDYSKKYISLRVLITLRAIVLSCVQT